VSGSSIAHAEGTLRRKRRRLGFFGALLDFVVRAVLEDGGGLGAAVEQVRRGEELVVDARPNEGAVEGVRPRHQCGANPPDIARSRGVEQFDVRLEVVREGHRTRS
jgi:hypothetical protein